MTSENKQRWHHHFKKTDAIAAAQLASLTAKDVIETTEKVHVSILQKFPSTSWLVHTTRLVYTGIKAIPMATHAVLKPIARSVHEPEADIEFRHTTERLAVTAALNGIYGDQFEQTHNPLATQMQLIKPKQETHANKLLFIHGLCMDDRSWDAQNSQQLATEIEADIWHLKYNTGLNIKANGQRLNTLLKNELKTDQPITLIGHSMGGLVGLYALLEAHKKQSAWVKNTQAFITLGTPFLGAPLAHWGHWVEERLSAYSLTLPLTTLTKRRSIGIQDLRHGFDEEIPDDFQIPTFCIAGHIDTKSHKSIETMVGDGLVTEHSALALHYAHKTWIAENIGHLKLQKSDKVYEQIGNWLVNLNSVVG
jgi:pimeloyl-ACP methyl ester carboxylesterase